MITFNHNLTTTFNYNVDLDFITSPIDTDWIM